MSRHGVVDGSLGDERGSNASREWQGPCPGTKSAADLHETTWDAAPTLFLRQGWARAAILHQGEATSHHPAPAISATTAGSAKSPPAPLWNSESRQNTQNRDRAAQPALGPGYDLRSRRGIRPRNGSFHSKVSHITTPEPFPFHPRWGRKGSSRGNRRLLLQHARVL
jgi:hypothetical protein